MNGLETARRPTQVLLSSRTTRTVGLQRRALAAGVPVVPVPGPSALIAALSVAGVPADRFVFEGFLPVKPGRRLHRLEALRDLQVTIVCYESPHRIAAALEAIGQVFGDTEIVVARELTKQFEEVVRGTPAALRERFGQGAARGEFTVIVPPMRRLTAGSRPANDENGG